MATKGCYLEIINRAFDSINVTCTNSNNNDWESKKSPQDLYNNKVLDKDLYYDTKDAEMDGITNYDGKFSIEISINNKKCCQSFNLKDGRNNITTRKRIIKKECDCMLFVTMGHSVKRFASKNKDNSDMGVFRIEVFSLSKRRFGIIADYHLNDERTNYPKKFITHLKDVRYAPEFIAVCGDLVDNSTKMQQDQKFASYFTIPFEDENFMIAEGFGNHDIWIGTGGTDMPRFIEGRNVERGKEKETENKLNEFSADNITNYPNRHYTWTTILEKTIEEKTKKMKIHFFMLNNLPGYEGIAECKDADMDDSQKNGNSPYESLKFLENTLAKIDTTDGFKHVAILFFHLNHNISTDWWSDKSKKDYRTVCFNSKIKVLASFFGHKHDHITKYESMIGKVDNGQDYTIHGVKCATNNSCEYDNYITFVDTEITDYGKLEMRVAYIKGDDLKVDDSNFTKLESLTFDI